MASFDKAFDLLDPDPLSAEVCKQRLLQPEGGLLPVGLKIHYGREKHRYLHRLPTQLDYLAFKTESAYRCGILPPVGSAKAAIEFLERLERTTGTSLFNQKDVKFQVCSPSRLGPRHAAILGTVFYLGSDRIRGFDLSEVVTNWQLTVGSRIVIYDGGGMLNTAFPWWTNADGGRVDPCLPFNRDRTDVLGCTTRLDIQNVNLAATLLVHEQAGGFFAPLGRRFVQSVRALLGDHGLSDVLEVAWTIYLDRNYSSAVHDSIKRTDAAFGEALRQLTDYALEEYDRIKRDHVQPPNGILADMHELLASFRQELVAQSVPFA